MAKKKQKIKPMLYVTISSETKQMRVPRKRIFALCEYMSENSDREIHDVDIAVLDSRDMAACNRKYLRHAGTTDVISFDLSEVESGPLSVQLIVCAEVAIKEAAKRGLGQQQELLLYIVHGLLHQLGCDDQTPADAAEMYLKQDEMLEGFLDQYNRDLRAKRGKKK